MKERTRSTNGGMNIEQDIETDKVAGTKQQEGTIYGNRK